MPFGREHCLLAVDEKIALFARREHDLFSLERALAQEVDEARARIAHRERLRSAARAPFFSAGTTGGGGPGRSSTAVVFFGVPLPRAATGATAGALRGSAPGAGRP